MAKGELKILARKRRSEGESIKTIARGLQVSSSTVSLWCRDIQLSPEQIAKLERNSRDPYYGRRLDYALSQQRQRLAESLKIKEEAISLLGQMDPKAKLVAGVALYWAEGFKKDNMVGFANTDPSMIKFIINWLIKDLGVPKTDIRLRVGINESHRDRTQEIEDYWSNSTNIPLSQFLKPYYPQSLWKKFYEHPEEYFGTLRIRVHKSTKLLKKIRGMIEGLIIAGGV